MNSIKIASAQINCTVGEIQQNLEAHYQMIKIAISEGVNLIAFPEMSITGYCREEGEKLAFNENDDKLSKLKNLSSKGNIIIVAGAPIKIKEALFIGAFVIYPDQPTDIYTKQYLHSGEELFYTSSKNYNPIIPLGKERISLAICADINHEIHPDQAKKHNATIYLPCIFYSENGIVKGFEQLRNYAKKYALNILMSNYSGELWNMKAGGRSAFWNANGKLIDSLDINGSGMLIAKKRNGKWNIKKYMG